MLHGRIGNVVTDLSAEPQTRDMQLSQIGLQAYAGVPVHDADGELYGTLCAVDRRTRPDLGERQVDLLDFVSGLVGDLVVEDEARRDRERQHAGAAGVRALLGGARGPRPVHR